MLLKEKLKFPGGFERAEDSGFDVFAGAQVAKGFPIRGGDGETYPLPDADFIAWREQNEAFSSLAVYDGGEGLALTGDGDAERIIVRNVTDRFFATLGVAPLLGRTFGDGEDRPGAPRSVVLSQAFWQRHFHGDSRVIGRSVLLDGVSHAIVGVMPDGANAVGAHLVGAMPKRGLDARGMVAAPRRAYLTMGIEAELDMGPEALAALSAAEFSVALSAYRNATTDCAHVMLPITPSFEKV